MISKHRCSEKFVAMRYNSNAILSHNGDYSDPNLNKVKYVGFHKDRRVAIKYVYSAIFGAPPEENWHKMKLVPVICHLLNINLHSHGIVRQTLQQLANQDISFYKGSVQKGSGSKALILHGTVQADIVYRSLMQGLTSKESTCILNMYRAKLDIPELPLSRSAVQAFITRSDCIKTRKRHQKKSGKDDPSSQWAKARQEQAEQFREQLYLGFLPTDSPDLLDSPFDPIYSDGIVFWDEHHREVILGEANAYQHLVSVDDLGNVVAPTAGGKFGKDSDITSI